MIISLDGIIEHLQPQTKKILYQPNNALISVGNFFEFSTDYHRYPEYPQHMLEDQPCLLTYKNTLAVSNFEHLRHFLPQLAAYKGEWIQQIPLFTRQAGLLSAVGELAIEGGPCMFGTDEVFLTAKRLSGQPVTFDLNLLFGEIREEEQAIALFKDIQPSSVVFNNVKPGITAQEYEFFDCLFQFAYLLNAPLVITIPDMSYLKFFNNLLVGLEEKERLKMLDAYIDTLNEITDLYLRCIELFQAHYRLPKLEVAHRRADSVLQCFYRRRQTYLKTKNLTSCQLRLDSIADYVSMPALPFYLWGIRNIIEINSTDETDSIRKCMRNHKNDICFHPIMIPEKVNARGSDTIFESCREDKGYIFLEELGF